MRLRDDVTRCFLVWALLVVFSAVAAAQPPPPPPLPELLPNLQPTEITFDPSTAVVGSTVFFDSGVQNTGEFGSDVFNIKWFVDNQEVELYESHAGVPAGQTVLDGNSQLSWTFDRPGTYSVTFTVDFDNQIEESNEEDNSTTIDVVVDQSPEPQPTQLAPGWYSNGTSAIICEDCDGLPLRIIWQNSYVYEYPGDSPLYWYAQVMYFNTGSEPLPITCAGEDEFSPVRVHMRGTPNSGSVPAEQIFCGHHYPGFTITLGPGESLNNWVIFPELPQPGSEVRLEWEPYGFSPWINPWQSPPFYGPPPAECPPELVTLGTCKPAEIPTWGLSEEERRVLENMAMCPGEILELMGWAGFTVLGPVAPVLVLGSRAGQVLSGGGIIVAIIQDPGNPSNYVQVVLELIPGKSCVELMAASFIGPYKPVIIPPDIAPPKPRPTPPPPMSETRRGATRTLSGRCRLRAGMPWLSPRRLLYIAVHRSRWLQYC